MAYTRTFTVDALGSPESVTVQTVCRKITLRQNDLDAATLAFYVRRPLTTSDQVKYPAGKSVIWENPSYFTVGTIIGYVETVSGSDTFSQEEE